MSRKLTSATALENLKREAKRWLKALRENAADARARLEQALPDAPPAPTLRHVQHALARERGFSGWQAMRDGIAHAPPHVSEREQLLRRFLDNACPDHHVRGAMDHVRAQHTAMRLLAQHPEIADASFYASVVTGNIRAVAASLAERPALATTRDSVASSERSGSGSTGDLIHKDLGPKGWDPLLYLAFTRLPLPAVRENALSIARMLLDAGADPNASFMAGGSRYTPLVGVVGEGEENRPPHPQRDDLVRLLLERGAEPYDTQVAYNIHFHGDVLWFLELAYERAIQLGREADWHDPEWRMFDMGNYGSGARWHLGIAVDHDDVRLAQWCLAHGASANAVPPRGKKASKRSLYEEAVRRGLTDMVALLVRYGAEVVDVPLTESEAFAAACMRMDRVAADSMLMRNPSLIRAPEPMLEAARRDRVDIIELLLSLGMSPNVANDRNERPLHRAAYNNSLNAARLLIDRGAEVDPVETHWGNTPLAAAAYAQHAGMIALLERVRALLAERPELGRVAGAGHTPLMRLPPDDERAALLRGAEADSSPAMAAPLGSPVELFSPAEETSRPASRTTDHWDVALAALASGTATGIDGNGQVDDEILARIADIPSVVTLRLARCTSITRAGLQLLARMPQLRELDLSECALDDDALAVLRDLPALERVRLARTAITDAGAANLVACERLERVNLADTPTGDGTLRALQGKARLAHVHTGNRVTNDGLPLLRGFPVFREWRGGEVSFELLSASAEPNSLTLRGTFSDEGLSSLVGLDGLFALNVTDRKLGLSAAALVPLAQLPRLGWLAFDAADESMPYIAALPALRFLMCQDTTAGDDGFAALSRSPSIEFIWGRRCHNLRNRGFTALSTMPSLRGLAVSCLNVDDAGLATLPEFPALRELMPMDVPDAGYRYVGQCTQLEALLLMYCRTTSDTATEHITTLRRLTRYFNSYTRITDRTPELLSSMYSLECIELSGCPGLTDAGVTALARLPRLRRMKLSAMPQVTRNALSGFRRSVECILSA